MIIAVHFPTSAVGKKKPEKNQGFNGIRTRDLHDTGIAEVKGPNPIEALIFFQASSFQLVKLEN